MSIQVRAIAESDTIHTYTMQIFDRDNKFIMRTISYKQITPIDLDIIDAKYFDEMGWENFNKMDKRDKKMLRLRNPKNFSPNTQEGGQILEGVLGADIKKIVDIIRKNYSEFLAATLIQIKLSDITLDQVQQYAKKSISGDRVYNYYDIMDEIEFDQDTKKFIIPKTRSYVNADTLLFKYNIYGKPKTLPYINYALNESGDVNCFYNHLTNTYKKISKKSIEKFNVDDGVNLKSVTEFCEKYKIPCKLYNIVGRQIYGNDFPRNKNHPELCGIISQNHFYPKLGGKYNDKPELNKEQEETYKDSEAIIEKIIYKKNNNIYTNNGVHKSYEITDREIDNELFRALKPNFNYLSENEKSIKVRPLMYFHKNINSVKYEYDMKKAYFNVAYKLLDGEYPIFSCFDLWDKYNGDEEICEYYYYLITEKKTLALNNYGITGNFRTGAMISFLYQNDLISKSDIEYVKRPSYIASWNDIKIKINNMVDKMVRQKLNLEPKINITDEHIKESQIDKGFVFYNGILGEHIHETNESIYYLNENEYDLLNFNLDNEEWTYEGSGENCIFKRSRKGFKYLNNTTIYNNVVEMTNIIMIQNILHIKKNTGKMPYKIKTDSIAYDCEVDIIPEHTKLFKIVTIDPKNLINKQNLYVKCDNIFKPDCGILTTYENGQDIIDNIKSDELSNITKNISYQGCPGTGKTTKVLNNHAYYRSTTVTNVCCLNISTEDIKGQTIYSLLKMYDPDRWYSAMVALMGKTVWIDEFSMVNRNMWNFFLILCIKYNCKLIISGDINQISPVGERKIDKDNIVFKTIMGETEILKTDYRNDKDIITLRDFVNNQHSSKIYTKFKSLNCHDDFTNYDRHIAFTHRCCRYINKKIMEKHNYIFKIKYIKDKNRPDHFPYYDYSDISEGVILSCRATYKASGIYKGDLWKVKKREEDYSYLLVNMRTDTEAKFERLDMKYFKIGFCITAHSSQGLTITDDLCIHEIKKMITMDKDLLYTAITRAREYKKLHLYYDHIIEDTEEPKLPMLEDDEEIYDKGQKVRCLF